ncbi:MAG TPA: thioredoxin-dependent thiol peroxidase [Polyangiaceae bacterium]|jgi:peroxiredoxin Q/BCP|nr:thioredoxin-dependent thiol peroxidase [Polyangiaceae bacterium]
MASAKKAKKKAPAKSNAKPAKAPKSAKATAKPAKPAKPGKAMPKASTGAKAGLVVGNRAPAFTLSDASGKSVSSASLAGAPYVLYFYPKDNTTGCTKQACDFRDSFPAFGRVRARVLGVSPDSATSHAGFAKKHGLPFTLLADPDKTLANAYGVWAKKQNYGREYMGIVRSTFVVDAKGVIQKVWRGVKVNGHVAAVLDAVKALS